MENKKLIKIILTVAAFIIVIATPIIIKTLNGGTDNDIYIADKAYYSTIKKIVGDDSVKIINDTNESQHDWEPSEKVLEKIKKARAIITSENTIYPADDKIISFAKKGNTKIFNIQGGILDQVIKTDGKNDPQSFMSIKLFILQIDHIVHELEEKLGFDQNKLNNNWKPLREKLSKLDDEMVKYFKENKNLYLSDQLICFKYLIKQYNIDVPGFATEISEKDSLSEKAVSDIISKYKNKGVSCIIGAVGEESKETDHIASQLGIKIARLYTFDEEGLAKDYDYHKMMSENFNNIKECK